VFFGINRAHQSRDFARVVFEGVAFSAWHTASVLQEFDLKISRITVAGGLSRIGLVNQIKADVSGLPVHQFKNFETTAIGAALVVLTGVGYYSTLQEAFSQFCQLEKIYEPDLENHTVYSEYFDLYRNIYQALIPCYRQRAGILGRLEQKGINELVMTENL